MIPCCADYKGEAEESTLVEGSGGDMCGGAEGEEAGSLFLSLTGTRCRRCSGGEGAAEPHTEHTLRPSLPRALTLTATGARRTGGGVPALLQSPGDFGENRTAYWSNPLSGRLYSGRGLVSPCYSSSSKDEEEGGGVVIGDAYKSMERPLTGGRHMEREGGGEECV